MKAYMVYGANTEVGKTVLTSALCRAIAGNDIVRYLKPVSTGGPEEADDRYGLRADCLYQFDKPVSPHIAATLGGRVPPRDDELTTRVYERLKDYEREKSAWAFVETAGGVQSPGPSGVLQADLYRPLRLPVILVADSKLGGISTTISAWESLHVRGYEVAAVLGFSDEKYGNMEFLKTYFLGKVPVVQDFQPPPRKIPGCSDQLDVANMRSYYQTITSASPMRMVVQKLAEAHETRVNNLASLSTRAESILWYPFSQHSSINKSTIASVDSAYSDKFQVFNNTETAHHSLLTPWFDGSASWWTQGLGHGNVDLSLTAANAAGRYGHVILANTAHEPAVSLAKKLIEVVDNPRINRVFYSDNGSTGVEVAIKMALNASTKRYGWDSCEKPSPPLILGLKNSYHGDTIGAMDASEPSVYNEKIHWYRNRGYFLDYPEIRLTNEVWSIEVPDELADEIGVKKMQFASLSEIYDLSRDTTVYKRALLSHLKTLTQVNGYRFGALLFEPVLLGAGGMKAVDPLFQRALVEVVRENPEIFGATKEDDNSHTHWSGLPVVFDEVFTGLYRLGSHTAANLLGCNPDISVHAKLLTGGLLPLCATLASEEIFASFLSDQKADALLHGHSYTAHPVGCAVALRSLGDLQNLDVESFKLDWNSNHIWSMWSKEFLDRVSSIRAVDGAFSAGTVLAITLKDSKGGYTSNAAETLKSYVSNIASNIGWNIHNRVLGNVFYIMASHTTSKDDILKMQSAIINFFEQSEM